MESKGKLLHVDAKPYRVVSCKKCGQDGEIERDNNFVSKSSMCKNCGGEGYIVYANRDILRKQIIGILFLVTVFLFSGLILLGLNSSWILGLIWSVAVLLLFGLYELLHSPIRERIEDYKILTEHMTRKEEDKAIEEYKTNLELESEIEELDDDIWLDDFVDSWDDASDSEFEDFDDDDWLEEDDDWFEEFDDGFDFEDFDE